MGRAGQDRWFVYVLSCGDGSLYVGIAKDVDARLEAHASGKGARYTRGRGPLRVAARCLCLSKGRALRAEYALKQLSKRQKEQLVSLPNSEGLRMFVRRLRAPRVVP